MRGGSLSVLVALSACGAPPPADTDAANNVALAPEDVLAESNASIVSGGNEPGGDAGARISPPSGNDSAAPPAPISTIPARFHGRWDASREACAETSSEMRLLVAAATMRFYESVGRVIAVRPAGDGVAVDLRMTGEGETRSDTRTLRLTSDGGLTVGSGSTSATRVRCPG